MSNKNGASATNRKFRILMAREGLVRLALRSKPWEAFRSKGKPDAKGNPTPYTKYCDRRWSHLRTMGEIMEMKTVLRNDPTASTAAKTHDLEWLDTFFVDTIDVVSPRFHAEAEAGAANKRAWEDAAWRAAWEDATQPRAAAAAAEHTWRTRAPAAAGAASAAAADPSTASRIAHTHAGAASKPKVPTDVKPSP